MSKEAASVIREIAQPSLLLKYVKKHRIEIDAQLKQYIPDLKRPNDQDRINWVRCTKSQEAL